ncbi:Mediator of replication checkpoint protein 1 [Cytospora mali]|uniref:Mediator of replication checkpoint protein 1 n=1 Tax=Cytospora mali TaxID=578113 RepID=A0A194VAI3_CYTMA|nr:Mediator of replication checkpoint protein 1 [Valsa mali var. pyri (nom. inval.)]
MTSSQPTSPVRSPSPDRFELSPASKLKKLLAAVDSDSDNDGTPRSATKRSRFSRRVSPSTSHRTNDDAPDRDSSGGEDEDVRPRGRVASRMQGGTVQGEEDAIQRVRKLLQKKSTPEQVTGGSADLEMADADDDEDDEDIVRPRGRLASRMQGDANSADNATKGSVGTSPAKTPVPDQPSRETQDVEMADRGVNDDNEDEDIPVRPRKLKLRQRRSKTPESTAATPEREASPGLFVTPSKSPVPAQTLSQAEDSGSDADLPALKSDRFKALVEKKRKERLAREAEEARKKEARAAAMEDLGDDNEDEVSDITDDEGGRKLTQTQKAQTRPSRKASKKAMEEMNRETQRIQRAMQLAHEAKTKKKITKATLFERFNFNPGGNAPAKEKLQSSSRPQTPASAKSTDAEMKDSETPPSSPPARVEDVLGKDLNGLPSQSGAAVSATTNANTNKGQSDEEFPDLMDMKAFARKPLDKGEPKATTPTKPAPKRHFRVKLPPIQANKIDLGSDDDGDDLVVLDANSGKLDALFESVPRNKSKESRSLFALRRLAHLDSPERKAYKKTDKAAMTPGELQAFLNQRAREQARLEKERRVEMLKAKGIHIQTEEERERDREQIEDMVARARREAEEIMERERDAAKKERKASGKDDPLAWDDSGTDDDYEEEGDEEVADADVELSGSEQEEDDVEGMVVDDNVDDQEEAAEPEGELTPNRSAAHALIEENAEEDTASDVSESEKSWFDPEEEEERHRWGAEDEELDEAPAFVQARRPKRQPTIISDDEDLEVEATPKPKTHDVNFTPAPKSHAVNLSPAPNDISPEIPTSVMRSANKSFIPGLPVKAGSPAGLGLTQIFAGTMDSQTAPFEGSPTQPMPTFDNFPDSQFSQNVAGSADGMILDSQPIPATQQAETQNGSNETQIQLNFTQSQTHGLDSLFRDDIASQASPMVQPTQDGGFQNWTPLKERFVEPPPATVETVVPHSDEIGDMSHASPLLHKRGRLRRKVVVASDSEDGYDGAVFDAKPSAFNVLKDAAAKEKRQRAKEEFDRKKSKAKEMVQEQAEESEDEYAGLGGVDGEFSDDDDAASVHEMIDDNTQGNKGDETKLAAFYADRERADDEKQVDKLFKDITTGMLRRKRGADYDLSDSDDGGEARRRMKRRQFAKMQKALFADERVSKVAENPRNQAFLRTIEDVGSDDEMDFLFEPPPQAPKDNQQSSTETQDAQGQVTVPDSQPNAAAAAAAAAAMSAPAKRAPASNRRTKDGKKPSNIGEIRETLSNLLDEPSGNTIISATDPGSESDEDAGGESANKENTNPRRRTRHAGPVVDRISLKRQGSSNLSNASGGGGGGGGRLAFAAPSSSAGSFRVPALLRKATTNSLMGSTAGSSGSGGAAGTTMATTGSAGGFGEEAKIKKNAGKRSGISYLARENDRRAAVQEAEKRREQRKFRAVEGRSKVVGGLFGAGKFE